MERRNRSKNKSRTSLLTTLNTKSEPVTNENTKSSCGTLIPPKSLKFLLVLFFFLGAVTVVYVNNICRRENSDKAEGKNPNFVFVDDCQRVSVLPNMSEREISCCHLVEIDSNATLDNIESQKALSFGMTESVHPFAFNDSCQQISVLMDMTPNAIYCWKLRKAAWTKSRTTSSSNNTVPSSSPKIGNYKCDKIHKQSLPNEAPDSKVIVAKSEEELVTKNESLPELYCKNSSGENVDWYYVINLPKIPNNANERIKSGTGFYYLDNQDMNFQLSQTAVDKEVSNPIANTLNQIYDPTVQCLIYNDHFPDDQKKAKKGHAKGVVAYRPNSGGFWMIHSIPKFPKHNAYHWPESAKTNGQTVLCVSLPGEEMIKIESQLNIIQPHVFFKRGVWKYPSLNTQTNSRMETFYSRDRMTFVHLAKAPDWDKEFYSKYLAPVLESELYARTWIRGKEVASDRQSAFPVKDVKKIKFLDVDEIPNTKDHSKWAISAPSRSNKKFICVGDLNRMVSQSKRGGGTMCAEIQEVWEEFRSIITDPHLN